MRNDRGLTQKDVANVLHVSQNTYSQYEIGVSRYPLDAIIKLAEYYGVSIDYLVGLTDDSRYPLDAIIKLAEYYGVSIDYLVGLTDEPKPYPRKKK